MDPTLLLILISLLFFAFFSGVEIAFVSAGRVRLELDRKNNRMIRSILEKFFRHQQQFVFTMSVGSVIALVVYGIGMARALEPLLSHLYANDTFIVSGQIMLSFLIMLFTAEYLSKNLFRLQPNFLLRFFFCSHIYFLSGVVSHIKNINPVATGSFAHSGHKKRECRRRYTG